MMLGLLISVSFLAHDLAMAGGVPDSDMRFNPSAAPAASVPVVHGAGGEAAVRAGHHQAPHQHCAEETCPVQSDCEITRVVAPTAHDALDATLQSIVCELGSAVGGKSVVGAPPPSDLAVISSRDRRVTFQVFLI